MREQLQVHIEYRIVRADGTVRWVEGAGQVLCGETGEPCGMVGVCADITDRKQAEEQREHLLEREQMVALELDRANRLKSDFITGLSHDLRNPLNAIIGYADLLLGDILPPDRATRALRAIRRPARAQAALVDRLLDLSRIEAGKLELDLAPIDLPSVLEEAITTDREGRVSGLNAVRVPQTGSSARRRATARPASTAAVPKPAHGEARTSDRPGARRLSMCGIRVRPVKAPGR